MAYFRISITIQGIIEEGRQGHCRCAVLVCVCTFVCGACVFTVLMMGGRARM